MSDYKHDALLQRILIRTDSPIGKPATGRPLESLDAALVCDIIDDAIAGEFRVYGGLHFFEFDISGVVNLGNRKITFPLYFEHCAFSERLLMGSANLRTLSLSGSLLRDGAELRSSTFDGGLFLRDGFSSLGPLLLRDIVVSEAIDLQKSAFLYNGKGDGEEHDNINGECVSLSRATANALYWRSLSEQPRGKVNFRDVQVNTFHNDIESDTKLQNWPVKGALIVDGFSYQHMTSLSPTRALKWLDLQENGHAKLAVESCQGLRWRTPGPPL